MVFIDFANGDSILPNIETDVNQILAARLFSRCFFNMNLNQFHKLIGSELKILIDSDYFLLDNIIEMIGKRFHDLLPTDHKDTPIPIVIVLDEFQVARDSWNHFEDLFMRIQVN
jgi:hypothetical protein